MRKKIKPNQIKGSLSGTMQRQFHMGKQSVDYYLEYFRKNNENNQDTLKEFELNLFLYKIFIKNKLSEMASTDIKVLQSKALSFLSDRHRYVFSKNLGADFYKSDFWQRKRLEVLKRDDYTCLECGSKESLHVHHVKYKKSNKLKDLVTLCNVCHASKHKINGPMILVNKKGGEVKTYILKKGA